MSPSPATGRALRAFNLPPTNHPTSRAATAAVTSLNPVMWGPRRGMERKMASIPSSGVATRKAMAAAGGAPFSTSVR